MAMKIKNPQNTYETKSQNFKGLIVDLSTLNILCRFIISDSHYVRLSYISDLKRMISNLDFSAYESDPDKSLRIKFIRRGIEARLTYNLSTYDLIMNHIRMGIDQPIDFLDPNDRGLSQDEVIWVHKDIIENSSKYGFVMRVADQFLDICTQIKTSDYEHRAGLVQQFERIVDVTKNEFRKITNEDGITDIEFGLAPGEFEKSISDIYEKIRNPSRKLKCGMKGLNMMTGGGFESGRVYMFLGVTGVGKSMTLLNLANQIKRYNKDYILKDPLKIPCVVYLTMENTVIETVTRLFSLSTDSPFPMERYSLTEVISKFKDEGQLFVTPENPINIFVKYKPNRSVDTSYLYTLYDDLNDKGYEPICLIQDHLLRIRSVEGNSETRFELGDIVNEFKTFAAEKDIPVLSDFHLNRDAMRAIEDYKASKTRVDITQKLGKSNVSESVMILNNTDCAIIINKDTDQQNREYMGFNLIKMRSNPELFYFAQPFVYGNKTKLVEDEGEGVPAQYKTSIHGNPEIQKTDNLITSSANIMGKINESLSNPGELATSFLNMDRYSNFEDFDGGFEDPAKEEEEVDFLKPPIVNPIIYYEPPEKQTLNLDSLNNLKDIISKKKEKINPIFYYNEENPLGE